MTKSICKLAAMVLAGALGAAWAGDEEAAAADSAASPPVQAAPHRAPRLPIASRVQLLARELVLDSAQQAAVAQVLEAQRAEVARIWSDASVSSALRVGATQAFGDKTADRIRALLSEEQRKKYIKPRVHDTPVGAPGGDVQKWMQTAQGLEQPGTEVTQGK